MRINTNDVTSVLPNVAAAEAIEIAKCADILIGLAQVLRVDLSVETAIWLSRNGLVRAGILKGSVKAIAASLILIAGEEICHQTANKFFKLETIIDAELQFQPHDVKEWFGTLMWVCVLAYMVNSGRTRVWHASHPHRLQLGQEKMERDLKISKDYQKALREFRSAVAELEAIRLFERLGMISPKESESRQKSGGNNKWKNKPR